MHLDSEMEVSIPQDRHAANRLVTDGLENREQSRFRDWIAVGANILDAMRGGFAVESGLKISFGIERTVSINGNLFAATHFNIQDTGKFIDSQTGIPALNSGMGELIQNGLGNTFRPEQLSQAATATFIQNSLNGQTIQSQTIINVTSNSLDLLKSMNLHSVLHDAMTNSAGVR